MDFYDDFHGGSVKIGASGVTIKEQVFITAEDIAEVFGYMRFGGIVGLAWPALSMSSVSTPMQNLLPSLDAPIFTAWLNTTAENKMFSVISSEKSFIAEVIPATNKTFYIIILLKVKMDLGGTNGVITYGAIHTTICNSEMNYVPLASEKYWQFTIEGFSVGSFLKGRADKAISDISTSWIGAPFTVVSAVVNQVGAVYNTDYQFYTVSCSTMTTLPDLEFIINGVKYNVPPKQYVIDIESGDGTVSGIGCKAKISSVCNLS